MESEFSGAGSCREGGGREAKGTGEGDGVESG